MWSFPATDLRTVKLCYFILYYMDTYRTTTKWKSIWYFVCKDRSFIQFSIMTCQRRMSGPKSRGASFFLEWIGQCGTCFRTSVKSVFASMLNILLFLNFCLTIFVLIFVWRDHEISAANINTIQYPIIDVFNIIH